MAERILQVNDSVAIPLAEVELRASRASGPGGQHVNKTSSRVEAVFNVRHSPSLPEAARALLLHRLARRLDTDGAIRVVSAEHRSQFRNREAALERLTELLRRNLIVARKRKATRPTQASRERRLASKKRRGAIKRDRRRTGDD